MAPRGIRTQVVVALATVLVGGALGTTSPASPRAHHRFFVDGRYVARIEREYTTRFPSRWTNQVRGTAWRTAHDAAALYLRDEWARLVAPFAREGAFAELRPFNFVDPTGANDNQDPVGFSGPENNVLAFVPGADPVLRNEVVIVGGHYDCVDITVDGGLDCGMQMPVSSGVLEALMRYWRQNNLRPRRSLAIFGIDGEEQCLCGSVHYTTLGSVNALANHLELPAAMSVAAYHDTDMIGANYPSRYFGDSHNDFMPLQVFSAPAVEDPTRALAPFAAYEAAVANPAFLARFKLYRRAAILQRDRFFHDMHEKYPEWRYRDGVVKPLFTDDQKKYVNITDDPLDRSDHTVFIAQGVPADINIGLNDPNAAPPGWISYHHVGESQEEVNLYRGGDMRLNRDAVLAHEATAAWIAYLSGAGEDSDPTLGPFFLGETTSLGLPPIPGVRLDRPTALLPALPLSQIGTPWRALGPRRTIVRGLTVDPFDPRTLYAASQDRGFLVSRDAGRTWVERNAGLGPFVSLWAVTTDPGRRGRLWAATHHGGVFRSDDSGRHWHSTRSAAHASPADVVYTPPQQPVSGTQLLNDNIQVRQLASEPGGVWLYGVDQCLGQYAPTGQRCATRADWPAEGFDPHPMLLYYYRYASDGAVLPGGTYLGSGFSTYLTGGGVFRTRDMGRTWSYEWPESGANSNLWRVRFAGGRRAYAAGSGGVFGSTDAGASWRTLHAPTSEVRALAVDPRDGDRVYAGSWDANGGIFRSTDGGDTWHRTSNGLPDRAGIQALAVDPRNPRRLAAATYWYGVYVSNDGGDHWRLAAFNMPARTRQRLDDVTFTRDGVLYAASHDGVFRLG
ncbi:MAG: M28 family peptidase [Mycobacteriales bacterium]|nr:M28 family peptidase [Frankia sp.]